MVHIRLTPSSTPCCSARALLCPFTTIKTSLASITVPTPTVSAVLGTLFTSLSKKRQLAMMVSVVNDNTPRNITQPGEKLLTAKGQSGSSHVLAQAFNYPARYVRAPYQERRAERFVSALLARNVHIIEIVDLRVS